MIQYESLLGRQFKQGTADCYALGRDFYKLNFDIDLPNVARPTDFWKADLNVFGKHYHALGFRVLDVHPSEWRPGDVAMMAFRTKYVNHCGVLLPEGKILHHLYNTISRTDDYNGTWRNITMYMLRHKDVKVEQVTETVDMMDLLLPSIRERLTNATAT